MAESATSAINNHARRQNALAEIQFASIVDDDLTPSEDETPEERALELETAQSAIGVSIGREQTRLTSPKTPAAEKAAALDATEDGAFFDGWQEAAERLPEPKTATLPTSASDPATGTYKGTQKPDTKPTTQQTANNNDRGRQSDPQTRLPSPWRAGPKTFQKEKPSDHRAMLRQHLKSGRRRASSGGSMTETVRKYINFNLPASLTKSYKDLHFSLPSLSSSSLDIAPKRRRDTLAHPPRPQNIPQDDGAHQSTPNESREASRSVSNEPQQIKTAPVPQREFSDSSTSTLSPASQTPTERPAPRLRRSNSEGSLLLYRSRSFASSLGDDSRFESVQEQVPFYAR